MRKLIILIISFLIVFTGCVAKKVEEPYESMRKDKVVKTAFDKVDEKEESKDEEKEDKEKTDFNEVEKPKVETEPEEEPEEPTKKYSKVTADILNMRFVASEQSSVIRQLYLDEIVEVLNVTGDWASVKIGEDSGYVNSTYLEELQVKKVKNEGTSLRASTFENAATIANPLKDEDVIVLESLTVEDVEWEHVKVGELEGYLLKSELR
ncbi:SH3 domain-containing protein [Microaceticoccus formicicus]|uniref:SH3 domain-containing protein n=1 Tax=Microaceticoccus formicicus TaxID=3118105 RepID=UPI003CD0419F|nr:SH3 domain-containing protein [Peptoniphilaceae bacterium AMB_02]